MTPCPVCAVKAGTPHKLGCAVERCAACGLQRSGCMCNKTIDMAYRRNKRLPWTGEFPGIAECRQYGLYCRLTSAGWEECKATDVGASPNLVKLACVGTWDRKQGRFVMEGQK